MQPVFHGKTPLAPLTTLNIGGAASESALLETPEHVVAAVDHALEKKLSFLPLGGGSNIVFSDGELPLFIGRIAIPGITLLEDSGDTAVLAVGAGEPWDAVVAYAVANGLTGIEALSAIPGNAGAAPMQNIGAYGAELSNVAREVTAYDTYERRWRLFSNDECQFSYRDSIFKQERGRFVITEMTLALSRKPALFPDYPDVAEWFGGESGAPSAHEIREAITAIRARKLPDPAVHPNAGSFFKNPYVDADQLKILLAEYPDMPHFSADAGRTKVPAGWLLERCGFKGAARGNIGTHENHALVIVNRGGATFSELEQFVTEIQNSVLEKFGIELEPEVTLYRPAESLLTPPRKAVGF